MTYRKAWIILAVAGLFPPLSGPARVDAAAVRADELQQAPAANDFIALYGPQPPPAGGKSPDDVLLYEVAQGRRPATVDLRPWGSEYTFVFKDPGDAALGATFQPVPEAVRAQLKIPGGRGLLVAEIEPEGPAASAGLKRHDILLTLADSGVASSADVEKALKAAGEKDAPLTLLRKGRPVTIQVHPVYRVTFGPVEKESTEYILGVMLGTIDDSLRSQLGLGEKPGLVVSEVVDASAAAKAGIKAHDVVLKYGGEALASQADLARLVNAGKGKSAAVELLREGKPLTIEVTPERRTVKTSAAPSNVLRYYSINPNANLRWLGATPTPFSMADRPYPPPMSREFPLMPAAPAGRPAQATTERRISALQKQIDALQDTVAKLRAELDAERARTKE